MSPGPDRTGNGPEHSGPGEAGMKWRPCSQPKKGSHAHGCHTAVRAQPEANWFTVCLIFPCCRMEMIIIIIKIPAPQIGSED